MCITILPIIRVQVYRVLGSKLSSDRKSTAAATTAGSLAKSRETSAIIGILIQQRTTSNIFNNRVAEPPPPPSLTAPDLPNLVSAFRLRLRTQIYMKKCNQFNNLLFNFPVLENTIIYHKFKKFII